MHSNQDDALSLEGVSKRFLLDPEQPLSLKDVLTRPLALAGRMRRDPFWALRDVTLRVGRGEIVGVIGRNGSGKSTLLRILAGISQPTSGRVTINGRSGALLELGAGFHPYATGRQNAYLNALFMGMTKAEVNEKMPEIVEFSGLGHFIDQPMRTYSSGMYLRLGFAVAVHVQPEILIVDEVLAVGDADFQEKCFDHFKQLKQQNMTIVIVTHNVDSVVSFADRAIFMERGQVKLDGDPSHVVSEYLNMLTGESPAVRRQLNRVLAGIALEEALEKKWAEEAEQATAIGEVSEADAVLDGGPIARRQVR